MKGRDCTISQGYAKGLGAAGGGLDLSGLPKVYLLFISLLEAFF